MFVLISGQLLGWLLLSASFWILLSIVEWFLAGGALRAHLVDIPRSALVSRLTTIFSLFVVAALFSAYPLRHQRLLREADSQLRRTRAAWEMSYQFINVLDRDGLVLETNIPGASTSLSVVEPYRGTPLWECPGWNVDASSRERVREACRKAATGEDVHYVATRTGPAGERQEYDVRFRPVLGNDGSVEFILSEARDITLLRMAEREKLEALRMLKVVLDTTPVRFFWKDRESVYLGCNQAFAHDMGLEAPDDVVGKTDFDILPPKHAEKCRTDDREVLQTGAILLGIEEEIGTPESPRWIRMSKLPLRDENGNITGILGSFEDVTESRMIRDELERNRRRTEEINADLEQRVRERTADLVQMNRELETFAHSAAHDLRTPLRAIDGWSHAILEEWGETLDESARERLGRVRAAAQRIGETLDDLLRLSQVSRSGFSPQEFDLAKVARSQRDMLAAMEPDRTIEWTLPETLPIKGDPELMRLMLWNLLENAVKFTSTREVARIEVGVDDKGLFVRDNGVGFDMAHSGKLFNAFQRLHLPEEFSGTGIGLAVVRRIAERHGGSVAAEGAPGQGATFWFVPND